MSCHVNVGGGVWKGVNPPGGLQVNVGGGVWKQVAEGFVNVGGGVWKSFYVNAVFALPLGVYDQGAASGTNHAQGNINFNTNGTFTSTGENVGVAESGNWVDPTSLAPGAYTIRAHLDSGTTPSGSALDTDLALSSARTWTLNQAGEGSVSCVLTFTLKDGGGNVVATAQGGITAEVLPF